MKTRLFWLFTAFLVLCGGMGFWHFSTLWSGAPLDPHETITLWSDSGEFIYTGATLSSYSWSESFFTGWTTITSTKMLHSDIGAEPRFYIEYPEFSDAQSLPILTAVRSKIMTVSADDSLMHTGSVTENVSKASGYDAYFTTMHGNNLGSLVYDIHRHTGTGGTDLAIKKVFLVQSSGKIILPADLVDTSVQNAKNEFVGLMTEKFSQQFATKKLLPADTIEQNLVSYLQDPQFAFAGTGVIFYMNSALFSDTTDQNIQIETDYKAVARLIRLEPKPAPVVEKWAHAAQKVAKASDGKKYVALTFDDGPHKTYTPWLLDTLKAKGVHATFFMLGQNVAGKEDIVKRMVSEGNEVGEHSWDHPSFTKLSNQAMRTQMQKTESAIQAAAGVAPKVFRPPYGAYNANVTKTVNKPLIMWSVDSMDWKNRNIDKNIRTTLAQVHDGAIILYHDIHKESVQTIPALIDALRKQWYEFLTVSELYEKYYNDWSLLPGQVCFSMKRC